MKKTNKRKGISLIVLVITIIVMIILAGAIILSLNSNGIIGRANKAKEDSDLANMKEAAIVVYAEYKLKLKTGKLDTNVSDLDVYVKEKLAKQGFSNEQLKRLSVLKDGTIQILPIIPKGFVMSPYEDEKKISEGLVIYELLDSETKILDGETKATSQTTRNQYVWIPVPNIDEFVRRDGYQNGTLQTFISSGIATEPFSKAHNGVKLSLANDLTGEYAEYAKMKASVEKYGGFYIARYEAGTTTERTNTANGTSVDNDGNPVVLSQKDKYTYNYVAWGPRMISVSGDVTDSTSKNQGKGAVELSRSIYPENENYDVVSTLIYGVQWDAVMNFMKDIENPTVSGKKYIEDSTNMGWYTNNSGNKVKNTGVDVYGSASNKVKNVYDMAGNVCEMTMESHSADYRYIRGSYCRGDSSSLPVSSRGTTQPNYANFNIGFRLALYLK